MAVGRILKQAMTNPLPIDVVLTEELLSTVAYELRMLKRRGVFPTLGGLGVFLVASVISVALTFGDFGDNLTPPEKPIHTMKGIPIQALRRAPLSYLSIEERLSWVEKRMATRR